MKWDKLRKYIGRVIKQHRELDKDEKAANHQRKHAKTMGSRKDRKARQLKFDYSLTVYEISYSFNSYPQDLHIKIALAKQMKKMYNV